MWEGLLRSPPNAVLVSLLQGVQHSGDTAVLFPSSSLGSLEAIIDESKKRNLRMAGVPSGGVTILPAMPVGDDELLSLCVEYCTLDGEGDRAEARRRLYLRPYPLFQYARGSEKATYHPADYVMRILQMCYQVQQMAEEELQSFMTTCPYLHISPIREICVQLRHGGAPPQPQVSSSSPSMSLFGPGHPALHQMSWSTLEDPSNPTPPMVEEMDEAQPLKVEGESGLPPLFQRIEASQLFHQDAVEMETAEEEKGLQPPANPEDDLTGQETVDAVHGAVVEYLKEEDFELVTEACILYDREGEGRRVAAVYIPNGIPAALCREAAQVLEPVATKKNLRAATNGGVPPDTGIVGYYDYLNNPTQHKCRETEFSRKHWGELRATEPFMKALDRLYAQYAPVHHTLQKVAIPLPYQLFGTVFSTVTVNRNFRTAVHTDKGDFRCGLGALCVLDGNFEGCHLAIKDLKKAFRLRPGDVLFFDTSLEHGNTEVRDADAGWKRTSVVCYLRNGLMSSVCELERRKHLNRLILQQVRRTEIRGSTININSVDSELPPLYVPVHLASRLAPVQLSALNFAVERAHKRSGSVVAMTMGLGKTLVALTLSYSFLHQFPTSDVLILTPKQIINHWVEEQKKWSAYGLEFSNFVASDGLNTLRFEHYLLNFDMQMNGTATKAGHVFVLNPEILNSFLRRFKQFDPALIIVDEGHRVAVKGSKLSESLSRLKCKRRVVLSGTPLQNDAGELYNIVGWVNKSVRSVLPPRHFQELAAQINRYVEGDEAAFADAVRAQEYIHDWMEGFVFREMENDLPALYDYLLVCGSSATQREYEQSMGLDNESTTALRASEHRPYHLSTHPACYLAFVAGNYQSMAGGSAKRRSDEGSEDSMTLNNMDSLKLEHYYQLISNDQLDEFIDVSGKLRVFVDIVQRVQAKQEKAIVFSQYVGSQDMIHRTLTALRISAFTVRGRDSQERRRYAMEQFDRDKKLTLLVLSTKIAAYGLDFTVANHVILFDSWWNPQVDAQAIARAYRRNQVKPVTVYRLASSMEDRVVLRTQMRKLALFRCLMHERTTRSALPEEVTDCSETDENREKRNFWKHLKQTALEGGTPALLNVYRYQEGVKETEQP